MLWRPVAESALLMRAEMSSSLVAWIALGWFLVEIVSMLTNERRRAVHDLIAGSVVVRCT